MSKLLEAIQEATRNGTLDELTAWLHPDTINEFCDAVVEAAAEHVADEVAA